MGKTFSGGRVDFGPFFAAVDDFRAPPAAVEMEERSRPPASDGVPAEVVRLPLGAGGPPRSDRSDRSGRMVVSFSSSSSSASASSSSSSSSCSSSSTAVAVAVAVPGGAPLDPGGRVPPPPPALIESRGAFGGRARIGDVAIGSGSAVDFGWDFDWVRGRGGGRGKAGGRTVPGVTGPAALEFDLDRAATWLTGGEASEPSQGLADEASSPPRRCWSANSPWGSYMLARSRRDPRDADGSHTMDPSSVDGLTVGPVAWPARRE